MSTPFSFRLSTGSAFRDILLATGLLLAAPAHADEVPRSVALHDEVVEQARGDLRSFYAYRDHPLWVSSDGSLDPAAGTLLQLIRTAEYDGLDPAGLGADELAAVLRQAEKKQSRGALARAELALSGALVAYAEALAEPVGADDVIYEHNVLRPIEPTAQTILHAAAQSNSLQDYVGKMRWMHPLYAQVRQKLVAGGYDPTVRQAALSSLQRIRALPAPRWSRHVVIDAASARLWLYEGDRVVDSMRVVVGKADTPTPLMAGYIRNAVVNPYWNVPEHLVRKTIAPGVISQGAAYLRARGYDVLSGWEADATKLNPTRIDWRAARDGEFDFRVRQAPSAANAMGRVKYEFPNPLGIYLHDTPDKDLMLEADRHFSNGCIRLEDADRLGRWLLGRDLPEAGRTPEQRIDLEQPVPVYITYLTVQADGDRLALASDPYSRDGIARSALARLD